MAHEHQRRLRILLGIMAFTTLSTVLHYTHNFVEIDQYPTSSLISSGIVQVGVFVVWPLFTAFGMVGYRLYSQRRYKQAHACLITYSFVGWLTLGHFTSGTPDIPAFWFATIFTDAIAAAAITGFVLWSARSQAPARVRSV